VMMHDRALPAPIDDLIEDLVRVLAAGLETPPVTSGVDADRGRGVGVVAPK